MRASVHLLPTAVGRLLARLSGRMPLVEPIVVGATGGSGTRALQALLAEAGIFMGAADRVNYAGDAMDFEPFLDDHINAILHTTGGLDYDASQVSARAIADFRTALTAYLTSRPSSSLHWGWKNPRSMYVLPILRTAFPRLRFIHLMRDGRDMAVSDNQAQVLKHYEARFSQSADDPVRASLRLWCRANREVASYCERTMPRRYLRVRLEDLAASPKEEVGKILNFVGLNAGGAAHLSDLIQPPDTMGRWRERLDANVLNTLMAEYGADLRYFGYADTE